MRRHSPKSTCIVKKNKQGEGKAELNTVRCKNMGQYKPKDRELYIQVLKAMLKIRGSRVRWLQLMQFLDFVQDICLWFPEKGIVNLETWKKVGDRLKGWSVCPFFLSFVVHD
jgi:hypothetical protein